MLQAIRDRDHRFSERIRIERDNKGLWYLMAFLAHSGDSWFWMAGLLLVWLLGKTEWHNRSAMIAIGIAVQIVVIFAIKFSVKRRRPVGEWGAFYRNTDPHSFPSGHAARAGLLAAMAVGLGPLWFSIALLIWAPVMSMARVVMGVHYLSDIVVGLVIGILVGWLVFELQPAWLALAPFLFT